jgi:hypothetical protein
MYVQQPAAAPEAGAPAGLVHSAPAVRIQSWCNDRLALTGQWWYYVVNESGAHVTWPFSMSTCGTCTCSVHVHAGAGFLLCCR